LSSVIAMAIKLMRPQVATDQASSDANGDEVGQENDDRLAFRHHVTVMTGCWRAEDRPSSGQFGLARCLIVA
jgi:hypothetical protein